MVKSPSEPKIFGLTGGTCSGKSTVARLLSQKGIPIIDADEIARRLRAPGTEAAQEILARLGTLEPKALRERITRDPVAKRDLESILHPRILTESQKRFAEILKSKSLPAYLIYEAALLIESGRASQFAGTILITADFDTRVRRLVQRDSLSEGEARQWIGAQPTDSSRLPYANYVLDNSGTREELESKVDRLDHALRSGEKTFSA